MDLPVTRSLGTLAPVSQAPEARCDNVRSSADGDNVRDNMMGAWSSLCTRPPFVTTNSQLRAGTRDYTGHCDPATQDTGPGSLLASGHHRAVSGVWTMSPALNTLRLQWV